MTIYYSNKFIHLKYSECNMKVNDFTMICAFYILERKLMVIQWCVFYLNVGMHVHF